MTASHMQYANATDEALMARIADGDVHAFEAVYDRHKSRAYSLARSITGRAGGAEEATQDAFLALWRGASKFDPARASLATWLLALVRYRSIDAVRRGAARGLTRELPETAAARVEDPERTDELALAADEHERARRLVAELPHEQREVLDLAYFAGYSQTEIAARVGVPLGTVKSRARLGLLRLRSAAEREFGMVRTA